MERRPGALVLAAVLWSGLAPAESPEGEWGALPSSAAAPVTPPPPPPRPMELPPLPRAAPPPGGAAPTLGTAVAVRPPEPPNTVSMLGAPTLGAGGRGQLVLLGFPTLSLRAAFGLTGWLDLGVGFDSFYGTMNEPRATARIGIVTGGPWTLALGVEGGYAFFTQPPQRETLGARAFTGRRNVNVSPALLLSYCRGPERAPRLFFELRYLLAVDLEPVSRQPLGGVPQPVVLGHNGGLRGGVEVPLSTKASLVFQLGLDLHGRAEDLPLVPVLSVGLVTGV